MTDDEKVRIRRLMTKLEARDFLQDLFRIAKQYHALPEEVLSRSQVRHHSRAREELALCMHEAGLSTVSIGDLLDRDHSSIISALKRIGRRKAKESGA